jgi:phosphopantetheinyl transferase
MLIIFNIGLSILSRDTPKAMRKGLLSAEGRRILSLFNGHSLAEGDILLGENGRPYFANGEANFNISHSGLVTAVSFLKGNDVRTGCDIQLVQTRANTKKIAEEFFSASERDYIFSQGGNEYSETRFFEIWALKECLLKLRGLTVFDMAKMPSFICIDSAGSCQFKMGETVSLPHTFYLFEITGSDERYILAVAIEGAEHHQPEIKWFSQTTLACREITAFSTNAP